MNITRIAASALLIITTCFLFSCTQGNQQTINTAPAVQEGAAKKITMVVSHRVNDFAAWKAVFDNHESARQAAQLSLNGLFQDANDPNYVMVSLNAGDLDAARKFSDSDDLKNAMAGAGVIDTPEINFYEIIFTNEAIANATDLRFFLIHKVQDFDAWKKVFDAHEQERAADGIAIVTIARNLHDPSEVAIGATSENAGALDRHLNNPAIIEAMKQAGVIGDPTVIVAKKVS